MVLPGCHSVMVPVTLRGLSRPTNDKPTNIALLSAMTDRARNATTNAMIDASRMVLSLSKRLLDDSDDANAKLRLRVRLHAVTTNSRFETIHLSVRRLAHIEQLDGDHVPFHRRDKSELADVRDF